MLIAVTLTAVGGAAISARDKYTVQVPGGLAFSEFRGHEDWQVIAVSQTGDLLVAILGNPEIIAAYQAGVPGNGKRSRKKHSIWLRQKRRPRLRTALPA